MTHELRSSDSQTFPAPGQRRLDGLADIDEVLRQLADLLCVPHGCRRRACRASERCAGGAGPPCAYAEAEVFVTHFRERTRSVRRFWARQRRLAAEHAEAAERPPIDRRSAAANLPAARELATELCPAGGHDAEAEQRAEVATTACHARG